MRNSVYRVFTDGACRAQQAAWASVILRQTTRDDSFRFQKVGFAGGLLNACLDSCEINALNAEATAFIGVAEFFLLSLPSLHDDETHCHVDALSDGRGTFGVSKCCDLDGNAAPRQRAARVMMFIVQRRAGSIEGHHIHAHVGHPWNELADSIAGAICQGWQPTTQAELRCQPLLSHPLKEWAWVQINPTSELPSLEEILQNRAPKDFAGSIDSTLLKSHSSDDTQRWNAKLRIATANVGILDRGNSAEGTNVSYKTIELLHQMQQAGIHILGAQEGRAKVSRHGPFDCLISAGMRGQAGVELWFHTEALSQICGHDIQINNDVCVWMSAPRLICASCNFGGLRLQIFGGYVPQAGRPAVELLQWWKEVSEAISKVSTQATIVILGELEA